MKTRKLRDKNGKLLNIGDFVKIENKLSRNSYMEIVGQIRSFKRTNNGTVAKLVWADGMPSASTYYGVELSQIGIEELV